MKKSSGISAVLKLTLLFSLSILLMPEYYFGTKDGTLQFAALFAENV